MIKKVFKYISQSVYETLKMLGVFKYINAMVNFTRADKKKFVINYIREHKLLILIFLSSILLIYLSFQFGFDKKITAIVIIIFGILTQLFTEMLALIAIVPFIGPLIVKVISIPFIILLNGIGYLVTFFALKKGYKIEVAKSKMFTTALLIGIMIGYIIGKIL